jgi:hypothetical protein
VSVLRHAQWEFVVNQVNGTYIFQTGRSFRGTLIRFRESVGETSRAPSLIRNVLVALANEVPETLYFAESENFNFIQIEIGDIPEWYN